MPGKIASALNVVWYFDKPAPCPSSSLSWEYSSLNSNTKRKEHCSLAVRCNASIQLLYMLVLSTVHAQCVYYPSTSGQITVHLVLYHHYSTWPLFVLTSVPFLHLAFQYCLAAYLWPVLHMLWLRSVQMYLESAARAGRAYFALVQPFWAWPPARLRWPRLGVGHRKISPGRFRKQKENQ